jgi:hypothetical protein
VISWNRGYFWDNPNDSVVLVILVRPGDPWQGISTEEDVAAMAATFLETIE